MLKLNKILFPIDFSDRSAGAAPQVRHLAEMHDSEVIVLHAIVPPDQWIGSPEFGAGLAPGNWDELSAQARQRLEEFTQQHLAGLKTRTLFEESDAARVIAKTAEQEGADLILMPTHGYGPFRKFLLGSVTAKVLHDAKCPIWTGAHAEEHAGDPDFQIRTVLCAVDLAKDSQAPLDWAVGLAEEHKATLLLMHVVAAPDIAPAGYFADEELDAKLKEGAAAGLQELAGRAGYPVTTVVAVGWPAESIERTAIERQADVVVIGRAEGGLLGRMRAHAYEIIRQSPCPVVSV